MAFCKKKGIDPGDKGAILTDIAERFTEVIVQQIDLIESVIGTTDDIKKVRELVAFLNKESPLEILQRSADKIWEYRQRITDKDEKYFLSTKDYEKYIVQGSSYSKFQYRIADEIKQKFSSLDTKKKEEMWRIVNIMLQIVIQYKCYLLDKEIPESNFDFIKSPRMK